MENIRLAYNNAQIGKYAGKNENFEGVIQSDLEKTYGNGNVDVSKEEELYIVTITGKGTYSITESGVVEKYVSVVKPTITYTITQVDGTALAENTNYDNAKITVTVSNLAQLDQITSIKLLKGENEITSTSTDLTNGTAAFTITKNGTYQAQVVGISEEKNTSNTKDIQVSGVFAVASFDRYLTEGKIDVIWLDANNNKIDNPEAPVLTITDGNSQEWGLTAVREYNSSTDSGKTVLGEHWVEKTGTETWYDYIAQSSKIADNAEGTSKWANAIAKDGSLFVWIPRYAYKITYYDTSNNIVGYSTNEGIINADGDLLYPTDSTYATNEKVKTAGYTDYIVHPAFTTNAENGGGWSKELTGFWFGKFEASNNSGQVKVVANVSSWTDRYINQMYNDAQVATYNSSNNSSNILQSHMVKNSEWGAVTYLAHSQYGLNGGKVMQNSSNQTTGGGAAYTNIYQSTTHNAYGVYDLNGTCYEYVASYVNDGNQKLTNNGNYGPLTYSLFGTTTTEQATSTKFKTVYPSTVNDGSSAQEAEYNLNSKMRGDAVFETSKSYTGTNSWYSAYSYFPCGAYPFFLRGGYCTHPGASSFYFYHNDGESYSRFSFRVALAF